MITFNTPFAPATPSPTVLQNKTKQNKTKQNKTKTNKNMELLA